MHRIKTLLILLISLGLASCAISSRVGPDYEAGRIYAYDVAKKDAWDFQCYWYPLHVRAAFKAREYTESLRSQGKSQMFIEGFYLGYERTYSDQLRVKCQE